MRLATVQKRNAFTLVELLVVIAIIVILMALTVGVISKVYVYLDEVKVNTEVNRMASGCEQFKSTFGRYPAAKIILAENAGVYQNIINGTIAPPAGYPITAAQWQTLGAYSAEYLTSIFPGINLNANHNWDGSTSNAVDPTTGLNVPTIGGVYLLEGEQSLVYFLGGIRYVQTGGTPSDPSGFNTDKSNPTLQTKTTRLGKFFEFEPSRLVSDTRVNIPPAATPAQVNSVMFNVYRDVYGSPYAYFSSRNPNVNSYANWYFPASLNSANDCELITFESGVHYTPLFVDSTPPMPITPAPTLPQRFTFWSNASSIQFHKAETYQIASSGKDKLFGTGGHWNQKDPETSFFQPTAAPNLNQNTYDNITNVTGGRVVPK